MDAGRRSALPVITRDSRPPSASGIEIWRTASSSPPVCEKPTAFHAPIDPPRATSSAAREQWRRHSSRNLWSTSTWVVAWSSARAASAETSPLRSIDRRAAAQELRRDDALQVLVEPLEEAEPAAVGLEPQPVELLAQGGEPLRRVAARSRSRAVGGGPRFVFGHCWHYRGSDDGGKAISDWLLAAGGDSATRSSRSAAQALARPVTGPSRFDSLNHLPLLEIRSIPLTPRVGFLSMCRSLKSLGKGVSVRASGPRQGR